MGLKPYILLAAASIFTLLMSCGDNIIEGGKSGPAGSDLKGTINVHVRNGAGDKAFTSANDSVYVTLIDAGTRPQLLGANGSVNFTNLTEGSYEIRVEKKDYATAYYTAKILQDEVTGNTGKVVNIPAVLYPLNATLTGTLRYQKADGSSGFANGAKVRIEVGVNRTTNVENDEDIKIEQRVHEAEVVNGKYTLTDVPAVPGQYYKLTALGFTAGGVEFADKVLYNRNGPDLASGATSTARVMVATDVVDQLTVISISPFVTGSNPIEITFNVEPENLGASTDLIYAGGVKLKTLAYDASTIKLTPAVPWKSVGGTIEVRLTNLRSKSGALLAVNNEAEGRWEGLVAVQDADREGFVLTNLESDGKIWIKDSAEAIVLDFSKNIDTTKLTATVFLNYGHKTTIAGNVITLTPPQGKWSKPNLLELNDANIKALVAEDGSSFVEPTKTGWKTIGWGKALKDPFILINNDTTLATLDSLGSVKLNFTLDIETNDAAFVPSVKIARGISAVLANDAAVTTALTGVDEVPVFSISGKTITVTPGYGWSSGATNFNAVVVQNLKSKDGDEQTSISEHIYYVTRPSALNFEIIETKSVTNIADYTSELRLTFSEAIDTTQWTKNSVTLDPRQPFDVSFDVNGTVVVLKPFGGQYEWLTGIVDHTPPTAIAALSPDIAVRFTSGLRSASGRTLSGSPDKYFVIGSGPSGSLTEAVKVEWFTYDFATTANAELAIKNDPAIQVAWRLLDTTKVDLDGYILWFYDKIGGSASVGDTLKKADIYPVGQPTAVIDRIAADGSVKAFLNYAKNGDDTASYALTIGVDGVKTGRYEIVIVPFKGQAVGGSTSAVISPAFTFASKDRLAAGGSKWNENWGNASNAFVTTQALIQGSNAAWKTSLETGLNSLDDAIQLGSFSIAFSEKVKPTIGQFSVSGGIGDLQKIVKALVQVDPNDETKLVVRLYVVSYNNGTSGSPVWAKINSADWGTTTGQPPSTPFSFSISGLESAENGVAFSELAYDQSNPSSVKILKSTIDVIVNFNNN